jgi:hypothetical protein
MVLSGGVAGAVDGGTTVSLGGVAGVVVVVVVVPAVPLVPEVVAGVVVVVVASLGGTTVVSVFLQAPSMAAMTAALRMIFDAFEKAFIV